jgi:hypothetical protein
VKHGSDYSDAIARHVENQNLIFQDVIHTSTERTRKRKGLTQIHKQRSGGIKEKENTN